MRSELEGGGQAHVAFSYNKFIASLTLKNQFNLTLSEVNFCMCGCELLEWQYYMNNKYDLTTIINYWLDQCACLFVSVYKGGKCREEAIEQLGWIKLPF